MPVKLRPSSGTSFHSLQATSHALQPMQTEVSVKNPIRGWASAPYEPGHDSTRKPSTLIGSPPALDSFDPRSAHQIPARARYDSTSSRSSRPRGRRPGRISHVEALYSPMWTFESSPSPSRSLAESPLLYPSRPQ